MANEKIDTVFDKLHVIKFITYEAYWISLGFVIFISGEGLILHYHEQEYLVSQIFFCLVVGFVPIFYKLYHKKFLEVSKNLNVLFEFKADVWNDWLAQEEVSVFTLKHNYSKLLILLLLFFVCFTLFYIPLPFSVLPLKIYSIL